MKNYFKKFSIMFVMLLAIIGVGIIQNGTTANAATVGSQLTSVEDNTWKRFDDDNSNIVCTNSTKYYSTTSNFGGQDREVYGLASFKFKFYGTKVRILSSRSANRSKSIEIYIDNVYKTTINEYNSNWIGSILEYSITGLTLKNHDIEMKNTNSSGVMTLDAIDIDYTGNLLPYNESISLDKSSMDLTIGESKQLTATTTPAGVEVEWSSSNPEIAKFDETSGKVIAGNAVGTATITAKIKGSETKATCTVNVTKPIEPTNPKPPVDEPTSGDANLFIELVDGNIKSYQVTSSQIQDFKQWYLDRDNTKSNKPYYEFTKGTYKDFVIHDKIDWFEVR